MPSILDTFTISGQTLGDLARIERGYGAIADRVWRMHSTLPTVRDAAEARQRTWDRLKAVMSEARRAYLFAHRAADMDSRRHWRRIEFSRRAEAEDILELLKHCRSRHHELVGERAGDRRAVA